MRLWGLYTVQTLLLVYIRALCGPLSCSVSRVSVTLSLVAHTNTVISVHAIPRRYQSERERAEAEGTYGERENRADTSVVSLQRLSD